MHISIGCTLLLAMLPCFYVLQTCLALLLIISLEKYSLMILISSAALVGIPNLV
jgi:hypothetical protein